MRLCGVLCWCWWWCGAVTERNSYDVPYTLIGELLRSVLGECAKYSAPKTGLERDARVVLFARAEQLFSALPTEGYRTYFGAAEEKEWIGLYKAFNAPAGVFWSKVMLRRSAQLNRLDHGTELSAVEAKEYAEELIKFLQELFDGAVTADLMEVDAALQAAKDLLSRHTQEYRREAHNIQKMLVERLLKVTKYVVG